MAEVNVTQDDVKRAGDLEKAISSREALEAGIDVCGAWRIVKPFWPWIIKLVRLIPTVGGAIAKGLEFLGKVLDSNCP